MDLAAILVQMMCVEYAIFNMINLMWTVDITGIPEMWTVLEYDTICSDNAKIISNRIETAPADSYSDEDVMFQTNDSDSSDDSDDSYSEADDEDNCGTRGLKIECPFNLLQSFDSVGGFPLDLMHDCMEGMYYFNYFEKFII